MEEKRFRKRDEGFVCAHCGKSVEPLGYSSRNHCPFCLWSLHVDELPGDRANECAGLMEPSRVELDSKKGYVIRGQSGNPIVSDFLPILWAFGGDIFDSNNNVILDSQESRDALEFYCKLLATGANQDKDDLVNSITSGEGALALGWPSWFISGNGTAAEIAQIPGKRIASSEALATGEIGNWLLGVTANSKNKELALELAIYLTSEEFQRKALESGGIPTRKSVFRDPEVLAKYPYFEAIYSGTNNSRVRPRTTKWSQIEEVFGKELVSCINGEQTVNETIKKSQEEISLLANVLYKNISTRYKKYRRCIV